MNKVSANLLLLLLLFCCICLNAQNNADASIQSSGEYIYEKNDAAHPCISAQEYQLLDADGSAARRWFGDFTSLLQSLFALLSFV